MILIKSFTKIILILLGSFNFLSNDVFAFQSIFHVEEIINRAEELWKDKLYEQSATYYIKAIKELSNLGEWEESVNLSIKLSDKLKKIKLYEIAKTILKNSSEVCLNFENSDSLNAIVAHKVGLIYSLQGKSMEAISFYKKAIKIRERFYSPHHIDLIRGLNNIGGRFLDLNKLDSALYYLKLAYSRQIETPSRFAKTCSLLAMTYRAKREIEKSENYYLLTEKEYQSLYKKQPWKIADFYFDFSTLYVEFEEPIKAIKYASLGLEISKMIKDKVISDYSTIVNCYNNTGSSHIQQRNYKKAINILKEALAIANLKLEGAKPKLLGKINENIGIALKGIKDYNNAKKYFYEALDIYESAKLFQTVPKTFHNLGDLYFNQNQYKQALNHYHLSLPYLLKNFQETDEYKNPVLTDNYIPDKKTLLIFLEAKAKTFKALYDQSHHERDLVAAYKTYQLLDELIDDIRTSYLEDVSKSYLAKQAKPIYEKAIGLCLQYHKYSGDQKYLEEAFRYTEKSKAIILLEQIKESKANIAASIPDSLRQKERQIKREVGQIEKELALQKGKITTDTLGQSLREQLIRLKNEYEDLVKQLGEENKDYHQLKYNVETVDIRTIQTEILQDSQVLVEYFVGEDSIYFFKISEMDFEVISKAIDFPLATWTDSLRQGLYYCRVTKSATEIDCQALDRQYSDYATKLYEQLISPIGLTPSEQQLLLIPDGVLGYIPFDALLTKNITEAQQNQFQQYPYFGLERTISYAFSATFLKEMQQSNTNLKNKELLAFAPSFSIKNSNLSTSENPIYAQRSSLSPLHFNQTEVEQILEQFGGAVFKEVTANKATFIQEAPKYRYLHIASHGKMNDENADLSYIAFSQMGDSTDQSELLYLRELYDLEIPAEMVVLSACETGIGELQNGEGIISLARGFSYAGAKSIITSLWNVNDQKTANLMVGFYKNLNLGQPKDVALANAKKDYITSESNTFSHPFYWAGFIPIGNMGVIEPASNKAWLWVLGFVVFVISGIGMWNKGRKTKIEQV